MPRLKGSLPLQQVLQQLLTSSVKGDRPMRITLNQEEIFEALGDYISKSMTLPETAQLSISLTAGRTPRGYTADVEILGTQATSLKYVAAEEAPVASVEAAQEIQQELPLDTDGDGSPEAPQAQPDSLFG